uniref:ARID domain-containing protein n=1 Tax=Bursaphelenchus xylophilus TaxID=6326 RepID=A0A1I7RQH6_BURXY
MSRDLTCNESLPDDGSGFSPSQNRNFSNQNLQQTASSSIQAIRDQILAQQQQQNQMGQLNSQATNFLNQPQRAASAMPSMEQINAQLNQQQPQNSSNQFFGLDQRTSVLQNTLISQYLQRQSLENVPTASLAQALLAQQSNIYNALPQLQQLSNNLNLNQNLGQQLNLARLQSTASQLEQLQNFQHQQQQSDLTAEQRVLLLQLLQSQNQNQRQNLGQNSAISQLQTTQNSALNQLQTSQNSALNQLQTSQNSALNQLQTSQTSAHNSIAQSIGEQGLNQLNQARLLSHLNSLNAAQLAELVNSNPLNTGLLQRTQFNQQAQNIQQQYLQRPFTPQVVVPPQLESKLQAVKRIAELRESWSKFGPTTSNLKDEPSHSAGSSQVDAPSTSRPQAASPRSNKRPHSPAKDAQKADETFREFEKVRANLGADEQQKLLDLLKSMQNRPQSTAPPQNTLTQAHLLQQTLEITEKLRQERERQEQQQNVAANSESRPMVRHVPGEEIFESLPKKRLRKQQFELEQAEMAKEQNQRLAGGTPLASNTQPILPQSAPPSQIPAYSQAAPITPANHLQEQPRKRGRPRTNPLSVKASKPPKPKVSTVKDAVGDLFLKPTLLQSPGETAISPAGVKKKLHKKPKEEILKSATKVVRSGSTSASSSCSATPLASPVPPGKKNGQKEKGLVDLAKLLRDRFPDLKSLGDLEINGIKALAAIYERSKERTEKKPEKYEEIEEEPETDEEPNLADFVEGALPGGLNGLEELRQECEKTGKSPVALKILDTVFKNDDLFDLAKVQMYANYLVRENPKRGPNGIVKDVETARLDKNIALMGMHATEINKKAEFVRRFIYEYTVLNLMNEEYALARGETPKEVFVDGRLQNLRFSADFEPEIPEVAKNLSCATLEVKLMDQMYRYRSAFFKQRLGKTMAVPRKSGQMNPDELLVMNMDVTATVYNMVESVARNEKYKTFEEETEEMVNSHFPSTEDINRIMFKTCDPHPAQCSHIEDDESEQTVIIRARNELSEEEELKQRLLGYLEQNTSDLADLTKIALKIRTKGIEVQQSLNASYDSELRQNRSRSSEPRLKWPEMLPLYKRRRTRSSDVNVVNRVTNNVGVRFTRTVEYEDTESSSTASKNSDKENRNDLRAIGSENRIGSIQTNRVLNGTEARFELDFEQNDDESDAFYGINSNQGVSKLLQRFTDLIELRRRLIAALVKLTMKNKSQKDVWRAAREPGVAVDTPDYCRSTVSKRVAQKESRQGLLSKSMRLRLLRQLDLMEEAEKEEFLEKRSTKGHGEDVKNSGRGNGVENRNEEEMTVSENEEADGARIRRSSRLSTGRKPNFPESGTKTPMDNIKSAEEQIKLNGRKKRPIDEYLRKVTEIPENDFANRSDILSLAKLTQTEKSFIQKEKADRKQRAKQRKIYKRMCDEINGLEVSVQLQETINEREQKHIDEETKDRLFNIELAFRRLKCLALKVR